MAALAELGFPLVAELLGTAHCQGRVRSIWDRIDAVLSSQPESAMYAQRYFAGVSEKGRYFELYSGGESDVLAVFAADLQTDIPKLAFAESEPVGFATRNGNQTVRFQNPFDPTHTSVLELCRTIDRTSEYYEDADRRETYGGPVFPVAHMQQLAGFDAETPRAGSIDYGYTMAGRMLRVGDSMAAREWQEQRRRAYDPDDLAM
jgi:hypothetical protein